MGYFYTPSEDLGPPTFSPCPRPGQAPAHTLPSPSVVPVPARMQPESVSLLWTSPADKDCAAWSPNPAQFQDPERCSQHIRGLLCAGGDLLCAGGDYCVRACSEGLGVTAGGTSGCSPPGPAVKGQETPVLGRRGAECQTHAGCSQAYFSVPSASASLSIHRVRRSLERCRGLCRDAAHSR